MVPQNAQKVDLYAPIVSARAGAPPLVVRVAVTPVPEYTTSGPVEGATRSEAYVLLSALPQDLQERVKIAVQALVAGR